MKKYKPEFKLVALIAPFARGAHQALGGCPPFPVETMLRIHCLQLWWKVRYRGLEKSTARLTMLFALGYLWMARKHILARRVW